MQHSSIIFIDLKFSLILGLGSKECQVTSNGGLIEDHRRITSNEPQIQQQLGAQAGATCALQDVFVVYKLGEWRDSGPCDE